MLINNLPNDVIIAILNKLNNNLENTCNWIKYFEILLLSSTSFIFIRNIITKISNNNKNILIKTLKYLKDPKNIKSPYRNIKERDIFNTNSIFLKSFLASNLWCWIMLKKNTIAIEVNNKYSNNNGHCVRLVCTKEYDSNIFFTFRLRKSFEEYIGFDNGILTLHDSEFIVNWVGYGMHPYDQMIYGLEEEEEAYRLHKYV